MIQCNRFLGELEVLSVGCVLDEHEFPRHHGCLKLTGVTLTLQMLSAAGHVLGGCKKWVGCLFEIVVTLSLTLQVLSAAGHVLGGCKIWVGHGCWKLTIVFCFFYLEGAVSSRPCAGWTKDPGGSWTCGADRDCGESGERSVTADCQASPPARCSNSHCRAGRQTGGEATGQCLTPLIVVHSPLLAT